MNLCLWMGWNSQNLAHPLILYALLALGLSLGLYLFVSLKIEVRRLDNRRLEDQETMQSLSDTVGQARENLERLENDLREVESQTGMLVAPPAARSGLNLGKRTQVLRLHRAGHAPAEIAATLELPRAEVELLVKVQHIVMQQIG